MQVYWKVTTENHDVDFTSWPDCCKYMKSLLELGWSSVTVTRLLKEV